MPKLQKIEHQHCFRVNNHEEIRSFGMVESVSLVIPWSKPCMPLSFSLLLVPNNIFGKVGRQERELGL